MKRIFWIMADSLGVGAMPDAREFKPLSDGDVGANTLGHIVESQKNFHAPTLQNLGLANVLIDEAHPKGYPKWPPIETPLASYGKMTEVSVNKDTPSGHWEMAGAPVFAPMPVYYDGLPKEMLDRFLKRAKENGVELPGVLGGEPTSGTEIMKRLGEEHIRSGKPIVYTSADSVFQIAAHETHFGLKKLYQICEIAREMLNGYDEKLGRVIARPFVGKTKETFTRTPNRKDYSLKPPRKTVLQAAVEKKYEVISVGKIADIYAHEGFTQEIKMQNNHDGMEILNKLSQKRNWSGIAFVNLVEFDSHYGHRRDPQGYARAIEDLDKQLAGFLSQLTGNDLMLFTADHGCDPTFPGSDHTREYVPILSYQKNQIGKNLKIRKTFADVAATITKFLDLDYFVEAKSWL